LAIFFIAAAVSVVIAELIAVPAIEEVQAKKGEAALHISPQGEANQSPQGAANSGTGCSEFLCG
jgi:hypothetical protein